MTSFESDEMAKIKHKYLFVSGCYRSGTTLLEKLLHNHPDICVASEPYPVLYHYVKGLFCDERNIQRRYPLGHMFLEDAYTKDEWLRFLDQYLITQANLKEIFDQLEQYPDGIRTPQVLDFRNDVSPGTFLQVFRQLNDLTAQLHQKSTAAIVGSKESSRDEYIPFMLSKGIKVIVIIRDPRDMISSMNFRVRHNNTGVNRPLLFSLRVWRRCVAHAIAYEEEQDFLRLRYEDIVMDPMAVLNRITHFLGQKNYAHDAFESGIYGQDGKLWKGNSSFSDREGIVTSAQGNFTTILPEEVVKFIESLCAPEMEAIGYDLVGSGQLNEKFMSGFHEPFEKIHRKFPVDYSSSPDRVQRELERVKHLSTNASPLSTADARKWFVDERAYRKLREVNTP